MAIPSALSVCVWRFLRPPGGGEDEGEVGAGGEIMAGGITEVGADDAMTDTEGGGDLVPLPVVSAVIHVIAERFVVLLLTTAWLLMLVLVLAVRHGMAVGGGAAVQARVVEDMEREEEVGALAQVVALSPLLADARLGKG